MSDFSISSQPVPRHAAVITMDGAQDDNAFDLILREFRTVLDAGAIGIVIDMSGLTSVTSAGLGAIADLAKTLAARDGKLFLADLSEEMLGTLELLGVQNAFAITTLSEGKRTVSAMGMSS